ncbi:MAG: hypothetical protein QXZ63_07585 [Sulfolobales archaeon]
MKKYILILLTLVILSTLPITTHSQLIENVYYINAIQGRWYAINTNGQSYRVFYTDSLGQVVYVTAYRWDVNNNYIIFQSPITGRIYLRQESYTLTTLDTKSWFAPLTSSLPNAVQVTIQAMAAVSSLTLHGWINSSNSTNQISSYTPQSSSWSPPNLTITHIVTYQTKHIITSTQPYPRASGSLSPSDLSITIDLVSINASYTSYSGVVVNAYHNYLDSSYNVKATNAYTYVTSFYYYSVTVNPRTNLQFTTLPYTFKLIRGSYSANSASEYGSYNYLYLDVSMNINILVSSSYQSSQQQDGSWLLTASNNNQIQIYDSLSKLSIAPFLATSSSSTYYIYTTNIDITFTNNRTLQYPLVVVLDTTNISQTVKNPNIAVFIPSLTTWIPAYLINYGTQNTYIIFPTPSITTNNLQIKIAWTYPIQYSKPPLEYNYITGINLISAFPISGSYMFIDNTAVVNGSLSLSNFVGSTVVLDLGISDSYVLENIVEGFINSLKVFYPQNSYAVIDGNISFTKCLILYNTLVESNYTYTISSPTFEAFQISQIAYMPSGQIQGSWNYRIPIYITLSELPTLLLDSGYIFRLKLPLKTWISLQLLSPGLEDLMIVDSAMRPQPFYIYDVENGIVYVRYNNLLYSPTIVLYVLLKNTQLWGSGSTFSTLSVFDKVNSYEFVDDFGFNIIYTYLAYNLYVIRTTSSTEFKAGKTWYDFMSVNNTNIYEQHGSTVFDSYNINLGIKDNSELIIFIDNRRFTDVFVYVDGNPKISFTLSNTTNPAYYVGYKNVQSVYVGKTLIYTYSVGDIQGGMSRPEQLKTTTTVVRPPQAQTIDWMSMFLMVFLLIGLGIAFKLMNSGGGSRSQSVLSRF